MSVHLFYHLVASRIVGCADHQIRMYVDDYELRHLGSITDRFYPDFPEVPTPYLFNECVVDVEQDIGGAPLPPLVGDQDSIFTQDRAVVDPMDASDSKAPVESHSSSSSRRISSRIQSQVQGSHEPETAKVCCPNVDGLV
jgi:hypothetical protein